MRVSIRDALAGTLASAVIGATAFVDGGYFPTAWGWSALAFVLVVAAVLIVADRIEVTGLEALFLAGLAALTVWIALSAVWSLSVARTVLEVERSLVYIAGAAALLLLARRAAAPWLLAGVLAAIAAVAAYSLATRLFPDSFGSVVDLESQLSGPLGYWNALGILAAIGGLLAVTIAAAPGRPFVRASAAATLPVLASTLYFTFSRGALVGLGVGALVTIAVEPRRLRLAGATAVLAAPAALAVLLASTSEGLAGGGVPIETASREGHRLAAAIAVLAAVSALLALALPRLESRFALTERRRALVSRALAAGVVVSAVLVLAAAGGPFALADRAIDAFRAPVPAAGAELESRLFSFSGNGRAEYWRVALDAYDEHPVLGSGAGTYELHWNLRRPSAFNARDAHSLYVETLAELGPIGLLIVLAALVTPLLAVPVARKRPFGPAATGGYAAFVVHAGLDWDWEVPAVTLTGIACAVALLVSARRDGDGEALGLWRRAAGLAATAIVAVFVFVTYIGNSALAVSTDASAEGRYGRAAEQARRAARWTPWASEPWREVAEAELALGRNRDARASFRKAIAKDRRDWELWYGLARASDGWVREAALGRARSLNPRSADVQALPVG